MTSSQMRNVVADWTRDVVGEGAEIGADVDDSQAIPIGEYVEYLRARAMPQILLRALALAWEMGRRRGNAEGVVTGLQSALKTVREL